MTIKIDKLLSCFSLVAKNTTKKSIYNYLLGLKEQGSTDIKFVDFLEKFYVDDKLAHSTTLETIIKSLFSSGRSILGRYVTRKPEHTIDKFSFYPHSLNGLPKYKHIYKYIIKNSTLEPLKLANFIDQLYAINNLEQHSLIDFDMTELLHSVIETYPDLLAFILINDVELNKPWTIYSNSIHHAISLFTTYPGHIMALVDAGADCNARNKYGSTVLHYLADKPFNKNTVDKWLKACIDHGANPSTLNSEDFTAYDLYLKTYKTELPILKSVKEEPTIDDPVSPLRAYSIYDDNRPILQNYPAVKIEFDL